MSTVHVDDNYVYNTYSGILDIYDIQTNQNINSIVYPYIISSMWSNNNYLFLGTVNSGVKYIDCSILDSFSSIDVYNSTNTYKLYPDILSNSINFIHGKESSISICSESGIDFFKLEPNGYRSSCVAAGTSNSFVLSERDLYYVVSGTVYDIYKVDPIMDWSSGDLIKSTDAIDVSIINKINTLSVTKIDNNDILFLSTDVGVVVVDVVNDSVLYIC